MKYLRDVLPRVPVLDPSAYPMPPKHLRYRLWRSPEGSGHFNNRKLTGVLKDVVLFFRSPDAIPIGQFQFGCPPEYLPFAQLRTQTPDPLN